MVYPLQPDWVIVGGLLLALLAFGVREVVGGALGAVGQDLWETYKRRRRKARDRGEASGSSC